MWTHGHFYWNELMTTDVDKARDFYAKTLGWKYDEMPMPEGTYYVVKDGETPVGGVMAMPKEVPAGTLSHWFSYIAVDDVDKRVKALESAGGKVMRPAFDVPEVGRIAIVADPTGAMQGWMTPAQQS